MAEKYLPGLEKGIERLLEDSRSSWELATEEKNVRVTVKPGHIDRYMAVGQLDAPVDKVLAALTDFKERLQWDKGVTPESGVFEQLAENVHLVYQRVEAKMGASSRDFVNARLMKRLDTPAAAATGWGVVHNTAEHPSHPAGDKGYVRAKNVDTGFLILASPDDPSKCVLYWIIETDLGGWIGMLPIRKITVSNLVGLFTALREYLAKQ